MLNTQENNSQNAGKQFKEIDFSLVKERFSLTRFCRDRGINVRRSGSGSYVVCCPFHTEDTPSCHIFEDRRYTCFGCGAKGTIIDFVLKSRSDLGDSPAKAAMFLIDTQGSGRVSDFHKDPTGISRGFSRKNAQSSIAAPPAVHALKVDKSKALAYKPDSLTAIGDQIYNPRFAKAKEYAEKRGWLKTPPHVSSYQLGAMMAGEKPSFLSEEPAVAFPKLIQTRRTAELFGLEKEFEENGRILCVGFKKRIHPDTSAKMTARRNQSSGIGKPIRWMATVGFNTEIPFEFDANEDASVLVICEGPGDGLRLFNEANATAETQARWGGNWHITAVDSCHIWNENSIPRRPMTWGSQNFSVSFFDGFTHVVILLDGDESGRNGVGNIIELARRQNPSAIIRNVVLPGNQDTNDFFDAGNTMSDLAELFRATAPVK